MATALTWTTINEADLAAAPSATTDPNVVDARLCTDVVLSAAIVGGTTPLMTVTVYYYDEAAALFALSGDVFILDPASGNLAVTNPNGLRLGFAMTVTGAPTSADLNIGRRPV
jgi:hypothetical protein